VTVTGDVGATGAVKQAGFSLLPVGAIFPYGGTAAPSGYLLCYGQSLLRASYPDLFTALGTTWGAVDGTHFTLPDLRGRVVAAPDNMGGVAAGRLNNTGGMTGAGVTGTGGAQTNTLSLNEIPTGIISAQNSIGVSVTSTVSVPQTTSPTQAVQASGSAVAWATTPSFATVNSTGSINVSATSNNTSGAAHLNVQPTIAVNYIIFAGV
jgi:microcystin-dependent protein